jgi:hypothetical protein
MKTQTKKQAYAEEKEQQVKDAARQVLSMLANDDLPLEIARTLIARRKGDDPKPCLSWSIGNLMLMLAYGTKDARGYRQWQAVGRQVIKGAKAINIVAPCTRTRTEKDPKTGEEEKHVIVTGFRLQPVFRIEDTEGDPLPAHDYAPDDLPPLYTVAEAWSIAVDWAPVAPGPGQALGCYAEEIGSGSSRIRLCTYDPDVFFHELGHAAFSRIKNGTEISEGEEEVIAESCSMILCQLYGYGQYLAHARDYLANYSGDAIRDVLKLFRLIEACVNAILDAADQGAYSLPLTS